MTIGSILVPFSGNVQEEHVLRTASTLAKHYGAHVRVLYMSPKPEQVFYSGSMLPVSVSQEVVSAMKEEIDQKVAEAHQRFVEWCDALDFPIKPREDAPVSASWVHLDGNAEQLIAAEGRLSDMMITNREIGSIHEFYQPIIQSALFDSARPVLLLPPAVSLNVPKRMMIAWDGSTRATYALASAMTMLHQAEEVVIVTVGNEAAEGATAERLQEYLHLHAIRSKHLDIGKEGHSVGEAISLTALEEKIDLLVMGAFTHNRFRQMIIGGVTDYMLSHAMIPVMMAH